MSLVGSSRGVVSANALGHAPSWVRRRWAECKQFGMQVVLLGLVALLHSARAPHVETHAHIFPPPAVCVESDKYASESQARIAVRLQAPSIESVWVCLGRSNNNDKNITYVMVLPCYEKESALHWVRTRGGHICLPDSSECVQADSMGTFSVVTESPSVWDMREDGQLQIRNTDRHRNNCFPSLPFLRQLVLLFF
eukprot:m.462673 g.462673  ORF g.462673 m.462673 type:complete len:195 (-) comp57025_c1_seq1:2264-2848(-)